MFRIMVWIALVEDSAGLDCLKGIRHREIFQFELKYYRASFKTSTCLFKAGKTI